MAGVAAELERIASPMLGGELPVGLRAWDGSHAGPVDGPQAVLHNRRGLRRLLFKPGELGLGRAYVSGDLDVDGDLTEGLRRCWSAARTARRGRPALGEAATALRLAARVIGPPPKPPAEEAVLRGRLHSILRDRAAISHHYDRGNEFYELILDQHMAYSCGYWTGGVETLEQAQLAKLELICSKLGLRQGMRLLDVGCGWGALLLHAAEQYGVRVVGITLSQQQAEFVHERAKRRGLDDLVEVRLQDYRELAAEAGTFDAVSTIEMGEHVGEGNYPGYAGLLQTVLRPRGRLLLQQMSRGAVHPGGGAFIESYIAPDMTMRPLSATVAHLERAGFEIRGVQALREHYVDTVRAWGVTLEERWDDVVA
ncbi:MAG: class I SAM-dependent methyltransferase, partial [Thermocrispum sp.]